uniref:Uncharacterized protein n=1 Tax=Ralstonia solanacearum TaxID=305 RepID=A0A0S4TWH9_RALSL|nr:protein of unknown function [Ralstonia solanacearum]
MIRAAAGGTPAAPSISDGSRLSRVGGMRSRKARRVSSPAATQQVNPGLASVGVSRPPGFMSKTELFHAEDEDEEKRLQALYCPSWWHDQTWPSLQASHPDQEDHQEQASAARYRGRP